MPILGDHYGREVEAGHVQLRRSRGDVHVRILRPRHARRPPLAQRPAQRGGPSRSGRTSWRSWPTRSATCRSRRRPTSKASTGGTVTRRSSGHRPGPALRRGPEGRPGDRCGGRRAERPAGPDRRPPGAAELPARVLEDRGPGAGLPPVLRHQHADQPADGGRAGLRRQPPPDPRMGPRRASSTASGSTTPTASATRPATSRGSRGPRPTAGSSSRRSSNPARPSPRTGRSPGPPGTTSSTAWAVCWFVDRRPAKGRSPTSTPPSPASPSTTSRDGPREEALRPQGTLRERRQPAGQPPLRGLRAAEALSRLHQAAS